MTKPRLVEILQSHVTRATGCTDPAATAFAVARTAQLLGGVPDRVAVTVSPNVFKNGISVVVPGIGKRGLGEAAALGAHLGSHAAEGLNILEHADAEAAASAEIFAREGRVVVDYRVDVPDPLYIEASAQRDADEAWMIIQRDYMNVVEEGVNGEVLFAASPEVSENRGRELSGWSIEELVRMAEETDSVDLEWLIEAAQVNKRAAEEGIRTGRASLGSQFAAWRGEPEFPAAAITLAKMYTAAATEARMMGLSVPVMAIAGSGNHGITNFLGVLAVAETLDTPTQELARALAISSAITVYIKGFLHEVSALCGCTVAAAIGVTAATVYLLGGDFADMVNAMNSVIGVLTGIVCDGAKESCAYKLSTATGTAIEYAWLAKAGRAFVPESMGIISGNIEQTIANLEKLNDISMEQTDRCMLEIIQDNQQSKANTTFDPRKGVH